MNAITVTDLTAGYGGPPVLERISLTVAAGSTTAVLGPSGGGKTTLLRAIAGFTRPTAGRITIGDRILTDRTTHVDPERRGVGYVRQDGALFPHLDVTGNILFGLPRRQRRQTTAAGPLLELVGLHPDLAHRRPDQLSGGQQQRVALARALARNPHVVLLDEPFSSLDTSLRAATRAATKAALSERGATALLVTHDQAEALSFADQVAVLIDGRLAQVDRPSQVYTSPANLRLAQFLGDAVELPGYGAQNFADCALGRLTLAELIEGPVTLVLRPEQVGLVPASLASGGPIAVVRAITFHGPYALVDLQIDGPTPASVRARVSGDRLPTIGDSVGIKVHGSVVAYPSTS
jgi:iron(III) transport system ATP-binding protein